MGLTATERDPCDLQGGQIWGSFRGALHMEGATVYGEGGERRGRENEIPFPI